MSESLGEMLCVYELIGECILECRKWFIKVVIIGMYKLILVKIVVYNCVSILNWKSFGKLYRMFRIRGNFYIKRMEVFIL